MRPTRPILYQQVLILATSLVCVCAFASAARGCPYSIRDAGFIVREPSPYRLALVVNDQTPSRDKLTQWLAEASETYLLESNVRAEVVNLDRPLPTELGDDFASLVPQELPAAMLLSPRDGAIRLPGLSPETVSQQAVLEIVHSAVISPKREDILAHIITDWCVVIVVTGSDAAENRRLGQAAAQASSSVVGTTTEMGQKVETAPHIITLAPDDPTERVLIWSLGLASGDQAQARIAVLFGMSRRIGPVLGPDVVSASLLKNVFALLGRNCTCTTDPGWLLGPAAPVVWRRDLQQQVYDELGFDPNSPEVAATLGGVWTSLASSGSQDGEPTTDADSAQASFPPPLAPGYIEFSFEPGEGQEANWPAGPDAAVTVEQHSLHTILRLGIILVLIAAGGSIALWLRQRRRESA